MLVFKRFELNNITSYNELIDNNIRNFLKTFDLESMLGNFYIIGKEVVFIIYSPEDAKHADDLIDSMLKDRNVTLKFDTSLFDGKTVRYRVEQNNENYYTIKCKLQKFQETNSY